MHYVLTMKNVMNSNNSKEIIIIESDEVVVTSTSKAKMLMMKVSRESSDYEEFRMKRVESNVVLGALH